MWTRCKNGGNWLGIFFWFCGLSLSYFTTSSWHVWQWHNLLRCRPLHFQHSAAATSAIVRKMSSAVFSVLQAPWVVYRWPLLLISRMCVILCLCITIHNGGIRFSGILSGCLFVCCSVVHLLRPILHDTIYLYLVEGFQQNLPQICIVWVRITGKVFKVRGYRSRVS